MFRNRRRSKASPEPQALNKNYQRTSGDIIAEFDEIYESSELRSDYRLKQKMIDQLKSKQSNFKSPQRVRLDQLERDIEISHKNSQVVSHEHENITQIRNSAYANDEVKTTLEKMKGRFDIVFNQDLPLKTKINKYVGEPLVFHLHKNRLFLQKINPEHKRPDPPTTQ